LSKYWMCRVAGIGFAAALGATALTGPATAAPSGNVPTWSAGDTTTKVAAAAPAEEGSFPKAGGPTYAFNDGDGMSPSSTAVQAVSPLPFDYTVYVSYGLNSRQFKTTTGKVCNSLTLHIDHDEDPDHPALNQLPTHLYRSSDNVQIGPNVTWAYDGVRRVYCCTGLTNGTAYQMYFGFGSQGGGLYVAGNGTMSAS